MICREHPEYYYTINTGIVIIIIIYLFLCCYLFLNNGTQYLPDVMIDDVVPFLLAVHAPFLRWFPGSAPKAAVARLISIGGIAAKDG
jgi:hypothetical protein